jgi:hypothetical protein
MHLEGEVILVVLLAVILDFSECWTHSLRTDFLEFRKLYHRKSERFSCDKEIL